MNNRIEINGQEPESLSLEQLEQLQQRITEIIARKREDERRKVFEEVKRLGASIGVDFVPAETPKSKSTKKPKPRQIPKYRNPENPIETWSGIGNRPKWIRQYLERNPQLSLDDLLIREESGEMAEKESETPA